MSKGIFVSKQSHQHAEVQARMQGYVPVGKAMNPNGDFVVFGRKARPFRS